MIYQLFLTAIFKSLVLLNLIDKRLMFAAFSRKLVSRINQTDIHGMKHLAVA
jgi:hypothetical protein